MVDGKCVAAKKAMLFYVGATAIPATLAQKSTSTYQHPQQSSDCRSHALRLVFILMRHSFKRGDFKPIFGSEYEMYKCSFLSVPLVLASLLVALYSSPAVAQCKPKGLVGAAATDPKAGDFGELKKNMGWCFRDNGAIARGKAALDMAVTYREYDLAVAGYVACQCHQLCAVSKQLRERYGKKVVNFLDKEALGERLSKFINAANQKEKNEIVAAIAAVAKLAVPVAKVLGFSCKNKTGNPIRILENHDKSAVWRAAKCIAHGEEC